MKLDVLNLVVTSATETSTSDIKYLLQGAQQQSPNKPTRKIAFLSAQICNYLLYKFGFPFIRTVEKKILNWEVRLYFFCCSAQFVLYNLKLKQFVIEFFFYCLCFIE